MLNHNAKTRNMHAFQTGYQPSPPDPASFESLLALGRIQGFVSDQNIRKLNPSLSEDKTRLEELRSHLENEGIPYIALSQNHAASHPSIHPHAPGQEAAPIDMEVDDVVGLYLHEALNHPLLSKEEEVALAKAIEKGQSAQQTLANCECSDKERAALAQAIRIGQDAFNLLVKSNTRLTVSIAKKYQNRGLPLADLIQAGNIGLLRAVKKFDYRRGYKFSTYATWWIRQGVTRSIIDQGRTIRIPAHTVEKLSKIEKARQKLTRILKRPATLEEIAREIDTPADKVEQLIRRTQSTFSLEHPVLDGDAVLGDLIEDKSAQGPEAKTLNALRDQDLRMVLEQYLPIREARILELRYGLKTGKPLTLQQVGEKEGITRERVRQIESRALHRLRSPLIRRKLQDYLNHEI